MPSPSRLSTRRVARASIALGMALIGVVLVHASLAGPSTPDPAIAEAASAPSAAATSATPPKPTVKRPAARADRDDVRDQISGLVLPESQPVAVSIPRIAVRSTLVDLGLDANGELQVPQDPARAGWFSRGAAPGALGPAVIAGHVTWNGAREVFYRLGTLRPGDRVDVTRRDGRTAVFTVSRVARFPKSQFPTQSVYGAINYAGLRLITCGGTYDAARHTYLDNVVAFARLSAVH